MKSIKKDDIITALSANKSLDNPMLKANIDAANQFYTVTLESEAAFLNLIAQYVDENRILMPGRFGEIFGGKYYTIGQISHRFLSLNIQFEDLAAGSVKGKYDPTFYEPCVRLYHHFEFKKLDPLVITMSDSHQQKDCPDGTFYLLDGTHRAITLGVLLTQKKIMFQPINTFLIIRPKS